MLQHNTPDRKKKTDISGFNYNSGYILYVNELLTTYILLPERVLSMVNFVISCCDKN